MFIRISTSGSGFKLFHLAAEEPGSKEGHDFAIDRHWLCRTWRLVARPTSQERRLVLERADADADGRARAEDLGDAAPVDGPTLVDGVAANASSRNAAELFGGR